MWRTCCTWARARSEVIQPELSSGAAILPSSVMADFSVTSGRPVRMKWKNGRLSSSRLGGVAGIQLDLDAGLAQHFESRSRRPADSDPR